MFPEMCFSFPFSSSQPTLPVSLSEDGNITGPPECKVWQCCSNLYGPYVLVYEDSKESGWTIIFKNMVGSNYLSLSRFYIRLVRSFNLKVVKRNESRFVVTNCATETGHHY